MGINTILNDGRPYYPRPKFDRAGFTAGALRLVDALFEKAHDQKKDVLTLHTTDLLSLSGIKNLKTLQVAREQLVCRGIIKAELLPGPKKGLWKISLCSPATGIPYCETRTTPAGYLNRVQKLREERDALLAQGMDPVISPEVPTGRAAAESRIDWTELGNERVERYFTARLPGQDFGSGENMAALCPFHDDTRPSLSIRRKTGQWNCHGCNRKGNIFRFERGISHLENDNARATKNVCEILGIKRTPSKKVRRKLESDDYSEYVYENAFGKPLYKVTCIRVHGAKEFQSYGRARAYNGWLPNMRWTRERVLYHAPDIRGASTVIVCEGEKDADRLSWLGLIATDGSNVACTTNIHGAMAAWLPQYSFALSGKRVVIMGDSDLPGVNHIEAVRVGVLPHAKEVRVITLFPGRSIHDKGLDVSDYLDQHTPDELVALMGRDWFWFQQANLIDPTVEARMPVVIEGELVVDI
jgi:CHC2 zinc finger